MLDPYNMLRLIRKGWVVVMAGIEEGVRLDVRVDGRLHFVQFVEKESYSCEVNGSALSLTAQVVTPPPPAPPVEPSEPVDVPTPREG